MTKTNRADQNSLSETSGLSTFPIRLEGKRYQLAVIDNMPLALMHPDRDEYYPFNPIRQEFVVKGQAYKLLTLDDKRYALEKVNTDQPLSFRVSFLHQKAV